MDRHQYDYQAHLGNTNAAAANVVQFVGQDKRVLEVGSGPGSITRLLKEAGNCRVTALEIDAEAARAVAPFCERVLSADLNSPGWSGEVCAQGKFDVVVAADVLEHLMDPWGVLRELTGCLVKGGYLVVSLPHAGHNGVIASLINGDLSYGGPGLLDRTHIRFFGIHNMQALFNDAALTIQAAHFVSRPPLLTELSAQWTRLPEAVRTALNANLFGSVYQVVVKAVPSADPAGGLQLAQMQVPDARGSKMQRAAGPVWAWLSARLSPGARDNLKAFIKRLGVRA